MKDVINLFVARRKYFFLYGPGWQEVVRQRWLARRRRAKSREAEEARRKRNNAIISAVYGIRPKK